jgi:hypothetical protein
MVYLDFVWCQKKHEWLQFIRPTWAIHLMICCNNCTVLGGAQGLVFRPGGKERVVNCRRTSSNSEYRIANDDEKTQRGKANIKPSTILT